MARVITTTKGQRQILITIDPRAATAFRLDVVYPSEFVTLAGFDGIRPFATDEGVTLVPPYVGGVGGGASILPKSKVSGNESAEVMKLITPKLRIAPSCAEGRFTRTA